MTSAEVSFFIRLTTVTRLNSVSSTTMIFGLQPQSLFSGGIQDLANNFEPGGLCDYSASLLLLLDREFSQSPMLAII